MTEANIIKRNNVSIEGNYFSKSTIIFAHGFGTDQSAWNRVKPSFLEKHKLILYDNTGAAGDSYDSYSKEKYKSLDAYARDLIEICAALNIEQAFFAGHSVSGMIGIIAASIQPHLFSKLILIGASPRYLNDVNYTGGFEQSDLDSIYENIESNFYNWANGFSKAAMRNFDRPLLREEFANLLLSLRPDIALETAKAIFQSDYRHLLPKINHDVLILQASNDIAVPQEVGTYLNEQLKNSTLITVNAEGHFPHMSAAPEVAGAIRNFIEAS
ncbi:alpha/beta fold hydrolase [Pararcticibacter amylolyticus]|uniref:Alpha/beta hydrolase n=1 Tax=Pararcticibacter amylolyticus TaxID=2173175 RepID=A0A2U2PH11_9SPHI|nr:alpha/beta hydrolase [Pararcticibacter amylolyticus]PWG80409.1 alpha/beta hydrolase [Pararcticibacter amylolyticus]